MNKFFISLVVLSCFFLLLFGSVSFANIDYSKFIDYNYTGTRDDLIDQMFELCFDCDYEYFKSQPHGNTTSNFTTYETFLNDSSYISYYFYTNNNGNYQGTGANTLYINFSKNVNWSGSNTSKGFYFYISSSNNYVCQISSNTSGLSIDGNLTNSSYNKVLYTDKWYVAKNQNFVPENPVLSLTYNNIKTNTIEVHYNGNTANFIKADYSDTVSSWRLGYFTNFNNSEVDEIYGYLYGFAGSSNQGVIYSDLVASFQWKKGVGTYTNNLYFPDTSDYSVFVNPQVITQYQGYTLMFDAFINREEQEVINNTTYLYFVPYGSSATSGDLISPDFNSGLDWNFINSIEHLYDSPSGNTEFIYNSNFNSSGDNIFGITYNDFDNWGFGDFVISSVSGFYNAFANYDNISLNFGYLGDINSSQFVTPSNTLFDFVGLISNSFLILTCIGFFYYTILDISTFNIDGLVKDREDLGLF